MTTKPTLSIGIPAYNEANNIGALIHHLLLQSHINFVLAEIIVISDGATDQTTAIVKQFSDPRLQLIVHHSRRGKAAAQNTIFRRAHSDVLLILDADILPADSQFLARIMRRFLANSPPSLLAVQVLAAPSPSVIGQILGYSQEIKNSLNRWCVQKRPAYVCVGRALAYSRSLYQKLVLPTSLIADDGFIALYCLYYNLPIGYLPAAKLYYQPPSSWADYLKQSLRFRRALIQLQGFYSPSFVHAAFSFPKHIWLRGMLFGFVRRPLLTLGYAILLLSSSLVARFWPAKGTALWAIAQSSKQVRSNQ